MESIDHLLGKIHQGDCLPFMRSLPDKCVDLILTDPPYEISDSRPGKSELMSLGKYNGGDLASISKGFDIKTIKEMGRVCVIPNMFIFCSNNQVPKIMQEGQKHFNYTTLLVWHKTNSAPFSNGVWRQDLEYCVHIRDKGGYFEGGAKEKQKCYTAPCNPSEYGHPTEKPIGIICKYLGVGSREGGIVFDPFMGSGTTAVACERLGRRWIGCELEPKYVDIANKRIEAERAQLKLF